MSSQSKTAQQPVSGKNADKVFKGVAYACGILILVVLAAVALFLLFRAWPLIGGDQKANSATISNFTGGKVSSFWGYVGPLLFGTVLISALALLISFFVSVGIALFISHYAPKKLATALSYVVDLLAAIPSVIYGLWGGLVLVPAIYPFWNWVAKYLGWIPIFAGPAANPSRTVATVSVVLAVMILPIITSMSRDIFLQTPRLQEEAALALGATKWEMVKLAVLPFGKSGVVSASHARPRSCARRNDGRAHDPVPGPQLLRQAAAGLAEPDHRREHRRAVSGSQRSGCFRADRHRPGPVPDYLRGELHRS